MIERELLASDNASSDYDEQHIRQEVEAVLQGIEDWRLAFRAGKPLGFSRRDERRAARRQRRA